MPNDPGAGGTAIAGTSGRPDRSADGAPKYGTPEAQLVVLAGAVAVRGGSPTKKNDEGGRGA